MAVDCSKILSAGKSTCRPSGEGGGRSTVHTPCGRELRGATRTGGVRQKRVKHRAALAAPPMRSDRRRSVTGGTSEAGMSGRVFDFDERLREFVAVPATHRNEDGEDAEPGGFCPRRQ